jgi:hypothetical protein
LYGINLREGEMLEGHQANGRNQLRVSKRVLEAQFLFAQKKNLYAFLFSLVRATYPVHLILFDLITLIIFGEEL